MQNSKDHEPEELKKRREFAYRAYSPDSEPPPPTKEKTERSESVKKDTETDVEKEGRKSA